MMWTSVLSTRRTITFVVEQAVSARMSVHKTAAGPWREPRHRVREWDGAFINPSTPLARESMNGPDASRRPASVLRRQQTRVGAGVGSRRVLYPGFVA